MPKYATIAFDSASEIARLYFSFDMKKHASNMDAIRAMQNYPGATERLNMLVRRMKDFRDKGIEIVFTAHEDIEKIYARGGAMGKKGEAPPDPVAVKGWPDIPGKRAPDEFCRAADNVIHVRYVNSKPMWIGRREPIGTGAEYWEVKDRFNAPALQGGLLPPSYQELAKMALANPLCNWRPPYTWVFYGPFGCGKTRSLLTFPRPMIIFDLDHGTKVFREDELKDIEIVSDINSEECDDYPKFVAKLESCL